MDAIRLIEIAQTVLTGLVLAFIFRAFLVEAFIIPTGSMAESLLGAHATQICPGCGWEFDFASLRPTTPTGEGFLYPYDVTCPNCQRVLPVWPAVAPPKPGDRVLVHKWPAALGGLFKPDRWDVVVFRDPANAAQHYIKRLIGLPGESVEILDGDIYIDGRIARKPPRVQQGLWFVVYDQSRCPAMPADDRPLLRWIARDAPGPPPWSGGWSGLDRRVLRCDAGDGRPYALDFNPDCSREYLRDFYSYNRGSSGTFVGDVRIRGEVTFEAGDGRFQVELLRAPCLITAELHRYGRVRLLIEPVAGVDARQLHMTASHTALAGKRPIMFELGHVDYRAYLRLGGQVVLETREWDYAPDLERLRWSIDDRPVGVRLVAAGVRARVERVRIDRDVHYLASAPHSRRALPNQPFQLAADEYFVLGDNSPDSHDSREWTEVGPHLSRATRAGTVPETQVVGHAAFVYLPGLLPIGPGGLLRIPDVGRVRFIR